VVRVKPEQVWYIVTHTQEVLKMMGQSKLVIVEPDHFTSDEVTTMREFLRKGNEEEGVGNSQ